MRTHVQPVRCPYCHKRMAEQRDMERHVKTHMKAEKLVCEDCGTHFTRDYNLARHKREIHQRGG